jgi:hypothetical protein
MGVEGRLLLGRSVAENLLILGGDRSGMLHFYHYFLMTSIVWGLKQFIGEVSSRFAVPK